MSRISSPWHDMFQKYHDNAKNRIKKITSRRDKNFPVPDVEDEDNCLWQVKEEKKKSDTEFFYTGKIKLRDILYRLQYFAHFNESNTDIAKPCTITMNILGADTKFRLKESELSNGKRGWQIIVLNADDCHPIYPKYEKIMDGLNTVDAGKLAKAILKALETPLEDQQMFGLENYPDLDLHKVRMFILLTHIAEAAVPSKEALQHYSELVDKGDGNTQLEPKHGRTPMMDKIVRAKLRKLAYPNFSTEFSKYAFPSKETNGTQKSREHALKGNEINPLSDIEDETDPTTKLTTSLANMNTGTNASDNNKFE